MKIIAVIPARSGSKGVPDINIKELANFGLTSLRNNPSLLKGLNIYKGKITHPAVADCFDLEYSNPLELL